MSRARNIKPGFYKNEDLAECSVWARLLFPGLWMLADREGRMEDRPKRIKGEIFPFDSVEVGPLLDELAQWKFILRYEKSGVRYIQIATFSRHQRPHSREKASEIPPPDAYQAPTLDEFELDLTDSKHNLGNASAQPSQCQARPDSLNPDSLNPDSLNPDSLNPKIKPPRDKRASPSARVEVSESEMMGSGITQTVASEYLLYRRAKKAPLTPMAWKRILSEIDKSGIGVEGALSQAMARGWQGFEAEWLREKNRAGPQTGQYHESERDIRSRTRREFLEQINGKPDQRGAVSAVIDGEAIRVD